MVATRAVCDVLETFREAVDALVGVDRTLLADGESMVALLSELSRVEAVVCRQTAAFDASGTWALDEAPNSTVWVTTSARVARRQSRRRLSIGRALRAMPLVEAAFLAGVLTAEHVEVLSGAREQSARAAAAVTGAEPALIAWATELAFHRFVGEVKAWLNEVDPDGSEEGADKVRAGRRVHLSQSFEGKWFLDGLLDPVSGEIVKGVLSGIEADLARADLTAAAESDHPDARWGDLVRTAEQRRADALVEMATRAATAPKDGRRPAPLFTVLVGESTFARVCELASGTVLTPGSLVPHLTESMIERIVFDGRDRVMAVGRQRLFTGAVRRAVEVRDRRCTHPFCDRPVEACQADHVVPWGDGGITCEANGRLRCGFHNRLGTTVPAHKHRASPAPAKTTEVFPDARDLNRQDLGCAILHP